MLPAEYYYMSGLPVKLGQELGEIHQPKIIDFIKNEITVEDFAQSFCVRLEILEVDDSGLEEIKKFAKDFDLFFLDESGSIERLIRILKMLYKTDNIYLSKSRQCILINNEILLNRENYTYLADVVLNMLYMEKPKRQKKERKYKDDYRQKLWEKMQKHRAEKESKERITLLDMVNIVVHYSSQIDYNAILNLTYYQLINSYITLMGKTGYDEYVMYKTSGQFKLEQDVKHWGITNRVKKGIAL